MQVDTVCCCVEVSFSQSQLVRKMTYSPSTSQLPTSLDNHSSSVTTNTSSSTDHIRRYTAECVIRFTPMLSCFFLKCCPRRDIYPGFLQCDVLYARQTDPSNLHTTVLWLGQTCSTEDATKTFSAPKGPYGTKNGCKRDNITEQNSCVCMSPETMS